MTKHLLAGYCILMKLRIKSGPILWIAFHKKKEDIRQAAYLLRSISPIEPDISDEKLMRIWKIIDLKNKDVRRRRRNIGILKYAASILFAIGIGGIFFILNRVPNFTPEITKIHDNDKGRIILSDGTTKSFDIKNPSIRQLVSGAIILDRDTIFKPALYSKTSGDKLNHIIIPYGKRSEVTLSDGTHIWLNSGSKFSYPTTFNKSTREVYLTGEAYFDVTEQLDRPFKIHASDIEIKVLGTSFNVSAYADDEAVHTVLSKGAVRLKRNGLFSENVVLEPGQRAVFKKQQEDFIIDEVDVTLYTSWVNGYLTFNKESVNEVFKKLGRHYNKEIVVGSEFEEASFSGKLDLKEDFDNVLDKIIFALPAKVLYKKNRILIKPL